MVRDNPSWGSLASHYYWHLVPISGTFPTFTPSVYRTLHKLMRWILIPRYPTCRAFSPQVQGVFLFGFLSFCISQCTLKWPKRLNILLARRAVFEWCKDITQRIALIAIKSIMLTSHLGDLVPRGVSTKINLCPPSPRPQLTIKFITRL